jgi:hypothetical protein
MASDYDEIVRVVRLYVDGFNDGGDVAKFEEAFHEDARMFFIGPDGALTNLLLVDCFEPFANDGARVEARILSVSQFGDAAAVALVWDNTAVEAGAWIDFHSLLRIDGKWKITNKTATHSSRVGAAGRSI